MTTLLGISGSLRKASTNTFLLRNAAEIFDADTFIEADINMPLYNGDLEAAEGVPAAVQTLSDQIAAADAVTISTPEYNKAISGHSRTRWTGSAGQRVRPGKTNRWPSCRLQRAMRAASTRSFPCAWR